VLCLIMAFIMVSSLRMQATMTTLYGLPARLSFSAKALMSGLQDFALTVAMYSTMRTSARPPQICRWAYGTCVE
jgi:hypothetical protein